MNRSFPLRVVQFPTLLAVVGLMGLVGCGHHRPQVTYEPPPPHLRSVPKPVLKPSPSTPMGLSEDDLDFVARHKPIFTEDGLATWYTAAKGRQSANGQLFDDNGMTAAHRTLPMGSLVKVTNLKTGQSAVLRITDRGPFVKSRIVDLTKAAAKATGVFREGVSQVRLDVYQTPKPLETDGRWCVQIGAFKDEYDALELKDELKHKYPDARVIEFPGMEASFWVRIRPVGDNREQAKNIAAHLRPVEGEAYLTRLD